MRNDYRYSAFLVTNRKARAVRLSGWPDFGRDPRYVRTHFTLNSVQKRIELAILPFDDELDTSVGEVADVSRHLEIFGERLACEAKPYPLDSAREMNSTAIPRHVG